MNIAPRLLVQLSRYEREILRHLTIISTCVQLLVGFAVAATIIAVATYVLH
jgi:hypothetical protein